jgi:TM2 domain-containing membrane protein YozV
VTTLLTQPRNRPIAIVLAFAGMVIPIAGLHKFYLGQPRWGAIYLLLSWTPIPHIASAIEAVWYLTQPTVDFDRNFALTPPNPVVVAAEAVRELDRLRADGLVTESEFEQKRRQLLNLT